MADTILTSSSGAQAILTSSTQGPSGSLSSPTGTGVVFALAGAIVGAAGPVPLASSTYVSGVLQIANGGTGLSTVGPNTYVLTSTGSAMVWAAGSSVAIIQLTGDVTAGPGTGSIPATVVRLNGATIPAAGALTTGNGIHVSGSSALSYSAVNLAGGSGWVINLLPVANIAAGANTNVLTTTGGVSVWAAPVVNAITQLTGDVTAGPGTGSVAATVVRVNGATVPAAGALTTGNSAYVSGASALTYSALNLAGGSGWVVNALPVGNLAFGTSGQLLVTNAGATAAAWVSASQDATLAASGAFTVTQAQAGAITFASGTGLIGFASADTGPGLSQASTSGATGKNLVLTPQPSTNGNGTSGNVVIALTAPTGSGSEAGLIVTRSGTTIASIQTGVTLSPAIGLYLGGNAASPTGVNYSLLEESGDTFINDTGALYFRLSNVTQLVANGNFVFTPSATSSATMFGSTGEVDFAQNVAIGTQSGGSFGGGVGVLELLNASTQPSTALSGGCILAAKSGALAVYDTSAAAANITINSYGFLSSANATSGGIGWTQSANTAASGTAVNMTLAAQSATGGGASFGGSLNLSSGSAATAGSINLQIGGTTAIQISGTNGSVYLQNSASGLISFPNSVSGAGNSLTLIAQTSTAGTGGNFTGEAGTGVTGGNLLLYAGSGSTTNGSLTLSTVQGGGTPGSWNWGGPALSTTFASISGGVSITSITATLVKGFPMLINGTTVHLLCTG